MNPQYEMSMSKQSFGTSGTKGKFEGSRNCEIGTQDLSPDHFKPQNLNMFDKRCSRNDCGTDSDNNS